ncbi:unnamed protein product [Caenorhabditis auriculariae]|uniref:Cytochrome P450 n=1 Tax=Caenorhabditis auriculariae TaxID=2777116 RepID=A0A8S1HGP0_9PELO|nr:unnamed protein product [Caenorhabditis auriculariae]
MEEKYHFSHSLVDNFTFLAEALDAGKRQKSALHPDVDSRNDHEIKLDEIEQKLIRGPARNRFLLLKDFINDSIMKSPYKCAYYFEKLYRKIYAMKFDQEAAYQNFPIFAVALHRQTCDRVIFGESYGFFIHSSSLDGPMQSKVPVFSSFKDKTVMPADGLSFLSSSLLLVKEVRGAKIFCLRPERSAIETFSLRLTDNYGQCKSSNNRYLTDIRFNRDILFSGTNLNDNHYLILAASATYFLLHLLEVERLLFCQTFITSDFVECFSMKVKEVFTIEFFLYVCFHHVIVIMAMLAYKKLESPFLAGVIVTFEIHHLSCWIINMAQMPPGPIPIPIFGHAQLLDINHPEKLLNRYRKLYGDIFTVYLPMPVVVVTSFKYAYEVAVTNGSSSNGRSHSFQFTYFTKDAVNGDGLILSQGEKWLKIRAFTHRFLTRTGIYGRHGTLTAEIHNQCIQLEKEFFELSKAKKAVDITHALSVAVANVIQEITIGRRYEYDDPEFRTARDNIKAVVKLVMSPEMFLVNSNQILQNLPIKYNPALRNYHNAGYDLQEWFRKHLNEHRETRTDGSPRDLMDFLLEKMEEDPETFTELAVLLICGDLWTGGMETTTTTLLWGLIYMIRNPEVQKRCHEEIVKVYGVGQPEIDQRKETPYVNACLDEIQRLSNVLPLAIPHTATRHFRLGRYEIEQGTEILIALTSILHDDKLFPSPYDFRPQRFFDEENGAYMPNRHLVPFGLGPRKCIGQKIAENELYVFFCSLIQNFFFYSDPTEPLPSLNRSEGGITSPPENFLVRIKNLNIRHNDETFPTS